ncbi:MAG: branched-chain amino acid ABC transporter permease [Chloroflexota bacterium]|nr:branched-chain amino acid ABC transporter permease [Chloroflexota bacterium]MDE3192528.1 branched-chain amino acid ABC transporter permease [Chloroflexota bacterium]
MRRLREPYVIGIAIAVLAALYPVVRPDDLTTLSLGFLTFVFITQAIAWNLVGGFAGQISFGFAAFFGTGAYVTAILWGKNGWDPVMTLPLAGLAAMIVALVVGLPTFRLQAQYFAIATIGVGEGARVIAINLDNVTGGASGLILPFDVPSKSWFYWAGLILATITFLASVWISRHRFGLALFALRMDQSAAESLGVPTAVFKNVVHMIAAFFVGVSAGLYVTYLSYAHPDQVFGFDLSIGMVLMNVIGGIGTLWGPILGALIYFPVRQILLADPNLVAVNLLIFGMLLIFIILFEPGGLLGLLARLGIVARTGVRLRPGAAPPPAELGTGGEGAGVE